MRLRLPTPKTTPFHPDHRPTSSSRSRHRSTSTKAHSVNACGGGGWGQRARACRGGPKATGIIDTQADSAAGNAGTLPLKLYRGRPGRHGASDRHGVALGGPRIMMRQSCGVHLRSPWAWLLARRAPKGTNHVSQPAQNACTGADAGARGCCQLQRSCRRIHVRARAAAASDTVSRSRAGVGCIRCKGPSCTDCGV